MAATAVVLVWFRPTSEYELTCCVPRSANYSRNTKDLVQAKSDWKWSEGSFRRRDCSLFSINMLSLAMCVPRKRTPAYIVYDLGLHVYAPACAGTTFTQYYQRAVYLGDWNVARDNKQARALLVPPGGSMNMIA